MAGVAISAELGATVVARVEGGFTDNEGKRVEWTDVYVENDGELAIIRQGKNDRPGTFETLGLLRSLKPGQRVTLEVEPSGKTKTLELPVYRLAAVPAKSE